MYTISQTSEFSRWLKKLRDMKAKAAMKATRFDPAEYLDNDEVIAEYLSQALADDDPDQLLLAIGNVARARGMSEIARAAGLGRESLYKALAPGAKPRFDTIHRVLRALDVNLDTVPRKVDAR